MDPQSAYVDYFRRMARVAPPMLLQRDRELSAGEPSLMSASLESILAFANLVQGSSACILDFGAGASSFVLRTLFPNVITIDHDRDYLTIVERVCVDACLCGWGAGFRHGFDGIPIADYAFYDYGTLADRIRDFPFVLAHAQRAIWVNDADNRPECEDFTGAIRRICASQGLALESQSHVCDRRGRSGSVVRPAAARLPVEAVAARRQSASAGAAPPRVQQSGVDLSVICGTYNRFAVLKEFVASVRQSVSQVSYEIVICDGGSTDGSREWLAAQKDVVLIGDRYLDGAVAAFNRAYEMSRGAFIANLNDDCVVEGDALARGVEYLLGHPDVGQVAFAVLSGATKEAVVNTIFNIPYANFGITRREAAEQVATITGGFWNPIYRTYAADCEHSAWVHRLGWKIAPMPAARVLDVRQEDALRTRNEILANREGRRFYARWTADALAGGFPVVSGEERERFDAVRGKRAPEKPKPPDDRAIAEAIGWPEPDEEGRLIAQAPGVQALDPVEGRFPIRAERLTAERVLHVHLGTSDDPQAGLVRALGKFGAYEQVNWIGVEHEALQQAIFGAAERLKPTIAFMQLQTPDVVDAATVRSLREISPGVVVATWCGDVASRNSPWDVGWQVPLARCCDLTLHSSHTHVKAFREAGVHTAAYLQIGYDEEQYRPSQQHIDFDVCFLGNRHYGSPAHAMKRHDGDLRDGAVAAFRSAFGKRFGIFGSGYEGGEPIALANAHQAYWRSRIGLNVSFVNFFDCYSSDRIFRILGCGSLLLTKSFPMMSTYGLVHGENCIVWETPADAVEAARIALSRPGDLAEIAAAGARLARERHTWDSRVLELLPLVEAARKGRDGR